MHFKLRLIPAATAVVLLAACGGGGSSSGSTTYIPTSGVGVDGYLQFSKVVCDTNDNGVSDTGEPVAYTTSEGLFTFPQGCNHPTILTGGKSKDTQLVFTGQLKAPAGAKVISPITSLMAAGMTSAQMNAALGLPATTDLLNTDPAEVVIGTGALKNPELLKKTLAVQQLLQKVTETFAGLANATGSAAIEPIYTEVATAFAATLATQSAKLVDSAGTIDAAVLEQMVSAAGDRVKSAATVMSTVKDAIAAAGGSATLAAFTGPALKAQAEAFLPATLTDSAAITKLTVDRQTNSVIASTVKSNVDNGTLKPGIQPTDISTQAANTATAAAAPTATPTPPSSSNAFISFDETTPAFSAMGAYGGALPSVEVAPTGGNGNALKLVKPVGPDTWGGVYFGTASIPFAAGKKSITAKVYSSRANAVIKFKVQVTDQDFVEVASAPTGAANTWSTVTWDFSAVDLSKSYTTIAITPDADLVTSGQTYWMDDITLIADNSGSVTPPASGPTIAAPTPTVAAANVISLFSDAYTNIAGTNQSPNWGQTSVVSDAPINGNATKKVINLNYQGIELSPVLNVSTMDKLHIDVWVGAAGSIKLGLINSAVVTGAAAKETDVPVNLVAGWNSVDIPLTSFTAPDLSKIDQLILIGSGTIYYDNLYFWKSTAVAPTNYLYLADNALSLFDGSTTTSYSMAQFQSTAGINVKWPMTNNAALKLNLAENGSFTLASGQTLSAAVSITQDTPAGAGEVKAYIDNVNVSKTGNSIQVTVPTTANAIVYGVSGDGKTKAIIDFANSVKGVTNTLSSAVNAVSTVVLGEVVNYAVNGVSNDFTGMYALRGKYKVSIVVTNLPLRQTDGSAFGNVTIQVPTKLDATGAATTTVPVTGPGLEGYINLTN